MRVAEPASKTIVATFEDWLVMGGFLGWIERAARAILIRADHSKPWALKLPHATVVPPRALDRNEILVILRSAPSTPCSLSLSMPIALRPHAGGLGFWVARGVANCLNCESRRARDDGSNVCGRWGEEEVLLSQGFMLNLPARCPRFSLEAPLDIGSDRCAWWRDSDFGLVPQRYQPQVFSIRRIHEALIDPASARCLRIDSCPGPASHDEWIQSIGELAPHLLNLPEAQHWSPTVAP